MDMGAFEFGDCNGNGVFDARDLADGTSRDCTGNGIPDECESDCNGNGIADSCDIAGGTSQDFNANGVPTECEPELVDIMDGFGAESAAGSVDTFVFPLAENVPLNRFTLRATEALTLISAVSTYTGPVGGGTRRGGGGLPNAPEVVGLTSQGDGLHVVDIDPAPEPGEWLKLSLRVRGASSGREVRMDMWLAHHPGNINQDQTTDVSDATAFGTEWSGARRAALLDLDGDGQVGIGDATSFGNIWNGVAPDATQAWANTELPTKP